MNGGTPPHPSLMRTPLDIVLYCVQIVGHLCQKLFPIMVTYLCGCIRWTFITLSVVSYTVPISVHYNSCPGWSIMYFRNSRCTLWKHFPRLQYTLVRNRVRFDVSHSRESLDSVSAKVGRSDERVFRIGAQKLVGRI